MNRACSARHMVCLAVAALMTAILVPTGAAFADEQAASSNDCATVISGTAIQAAGHLSMMVAHPQSTTDVDTSWYSASENDFTLTTNEQLNGLAELVNSGTESFAGKTVTLGSFQMMPTLTSVGTPQHPFQGTFDGAEKSIVAPEITSTLGTTYVGLIGYAGDSAIIKNVRILGGSLTLSNDNSEIRYVGAVAGYTEGAVVNCSNTMDIVCSSTLIPTKDVPGMVRAVGGVVGCAKNNVESCSNSGAIQISALPPELKDDANVITGEIGGVVGILGDPGSVAHPGDITDCSNSGGISITTPGYAVGKDRFDADIFVNSYSVGGIVGYSTGSVMRCTNASAVLTSKAYDSKTGEVADEKAGVGCQNCGGIVGSLRDISLEEFCFDTGLDDPAYEAWKAVGGASAPDTLSIVNCKNEESGVVEGVGTVGGIVGEACAFTEIKGCGNNAQITGTRWNKPCPAGIAGRSYGSVIACYNNGRIASLTGAGYYAAGLVGGLHTYNEQTTPDNLVMDYPEVYSCYSTGNIMSEIAGYKTGSLVGANGDFDDGGSVHDNVYLPRLSLDNTPIAQDSGSSYNNTEISANDLKTSAAIALINKMLVANSSGWDGDYFVVSSGINKGFPMLTWEGTPSVYSNVEPVSATLAGNATYAADYDPAPLVTVKARVNGSTKTLVQDADFKVIPQEGARAVAESGYTAHVYGVGQYEGVDFGTVEYGIDKADIATCSIVAAATIFNWGQQQPAWVKVYDAAGNEVDASEYTWSVPMASLDELGADGSNYRADGRAKDDDPDHGVIKGNYYDYVNSHAEGYKYDVIVTAKDDSSCYYGSLEQQCFRIGAASMMDSDAEVSDTSDHAEFDYVAWGDQQWAFGEDVLDATNSPIDIKYTGSPITPTIAKPTYLGRPVRNGTDAEYWNAPTAYDYRYVYGNTNAEPNSSDTSQCVNVTDDEHLACMTVRYSTNGCNFHNYTNIYFNIVPASVVEDVTIANPESGNPTLTYNGMTLVKGTDYTLETAVDGLTTTLTITGIGNYGDTKIIEIVEADLAELNAAVKHAESLVPGDYTAESWSAVQAALQTAKAMNKNNAQDDVDAALATLNEAVDSLVKSAAQPVSKAGTWKKSSKGWWYEYPDKTYAQNELLSIGGKNYWFKSSGYMATGWVKIGVKWYFFNSSGAMAKGWVKTGGKWYYMKTDGTMAANEWCKGYWINKSGTWTYGYKGSWKKDKTGWWFGDTSGWYAKNCTQVIDGVTYRFNSKGYMV